MVDEPRRLPFETMIGTDLSGWWSGFYQYPQNHPSAMHGRPEVPFSAYLEMTPGGVISGSIQDDASRGGHPSLGIVKGRFDGQTIRFAKTMPDLFMVAPSGGSVIVEGRPYTIGYTGNLGSDGVFRGVWKLGWALRFVHGWLYIVRPSSAAWEMQRASDTA